jgi:hypothetical protein
MGAGDQLEVVQDGSRWLHGPPSAEQLAEWFKLQPLHDGMEHDRYVSGIIVLPQTEEIEVTKAKQNGDTYTTKVERATYVPYVNISTRVRYFHDLARKMREGDAGIDVRSLFRPVGQAQISDLSNAYYNENLPDGFSVAAIKNQNDTLKRFFVATFEAAIVEREFVRDFLAGEDVPVEIHGAGSKQVPMNYRNGWGDEAALMKAETGAHGRALGMASILVIGTGVATAEDMQEAIAGGGAVQEGPVVQQAPLTPEAAAPVALGGSGAEEVVEQTQEQQDEALRARAMDLQREMSRDHPAQWETYRRWWTEDRQFPPLAELSGPALRGAVTKLERDLDAAKQG